MKLISRRSLSGLYPHHKVRTLSTPLKGREPMRCSLDEAVQSIQSCEHVFLHHGPSTPVDLVFSLFKSMEKRDLTDITFTHGLTLGMNLESLEQTFLDRFRSTSIFIGPDFRKLVNQGKADYIPLLLSESGRIYDEKMFPVDTALLNLSPPDKHGYCSLGVNVDMSSAAARNATKIIATINQSQPRTFGDSEIHVSQIDFLVDACSTPISVLPTAKSTQEEDQIADLIANNLVENESTLQLGIGSLPNSVLHKLRDHKDLGIHTEMISDGIIELIKENVITNNKKTLFPGKCITSFALGSRQLYEFLDDNPLFLFGSAGYTNSIPVISQNNKMTAINSAIEIDLTGQVVSDSIGKRFYSGFGGQLDFIYGASQTFDGMGKSIIALPSTTKRGESKIVPIIKDGAGVVTTRAQCRYVVTEYGIAQLWGKNVRQRAFELIKISHPDHRQNLERAAFERFNCIPSPD